MATFKGFKNRRLKSLHEREDPSRVSARNLEKINRILDTLDAATRPEEMDLPGFRLHPLKGELKGHWAVDVSANWRITFRIEEGNACEVDLIDYH